jgi:hypothetical protein
MNLRNRAPNVSTWLDRLGLPGGNHKWIDAWNFQELPTPAVPVVPIISDLQEPYVEERLRWDHAALGYGQFT